MKAAARVMKGRRVEWRQRRAKREQVREQEVQQVGRDGQEAGVGQKQQEQEGGEQVGGGRWWVCWVFTQRIIPVSWHTPRRV